MGRQSLLSNHARRFLCSSISHHHHLSSITQIPSFHSLSAPRSYWNLTHRLTPPLDPHPLAFLNSIPFRSCSFHAAAGGHDRRDRDNIVECSGGEPGVFDQGLDGPEVADGGDRWYSPVRVVMLLLDGAYDLTGLPWWAVIATSTLALRMALLPMLVLQLKKLERMSKLMPKLPPPFPPPLSGKSLREQFSLFQKERRAIGCPSPLWSFASFFVQGGILWFQNLTEFPHGAFSPIFPILIAGLHFVNVQVSFKTSAVVKVPGLIGLLAKYYKLYLDVLTMPLLLIGFYVPQGSLVYWLTNSSLNLVQQLSFKNPYFRTILGLRPDFVQSEHKTPTVNSPPGGDIHPLSLNHPYILQKLGLPAKYVPAKHEMPKENLPPDELHVLALQHLATGDHDRALPLLRLAAEKEPELGRASIAMGLLLLSRGLLTEAANYFEHAISKNKDNDVTNLIIASFGAGVSLVSQPGRQLEGIEHLKRIADLKEPEDPLDRHCYFQGLVMLGSTLFNEGQKAEAAKYLRIAAAYDPAVNAYVEECERDECIKSI